MVAAGLTILVGGALLTGCGGGGVTGLTGATRPQYVYTQNLGEIAIAQYKAGGDGTLTPLTPPSVPSEPGNFSIVADPQGKFLYSANIGTNTITQYAIDGEGKLSALIPASVPNPGGGRALFMDPNSRFVYTANIDRSVNEYRIGANGALTQVGNFGPDLLLGQVQSINFAPSGQFAYLVGEAVLQMRINADGTLASSGPRRALATTAAGVATDTSGNVLYISQAANNEILQFTINGDGSLTPLATPSVPAAGGPARLYRSPGGFIYAATSSGILQYRVGAGGALQAMGAGPVGSQISALAFSPDGRFAYSVETNSDSLLQYRVNGDGTLGALGRPTTVTGTGQVSVAVVAR